MKNYNLSTLLKIREQRKSAAEINLRTASQQHDIEKQKLVKIQTSLKETVNKRSQLQTNFFLKASSSPFNQREVLCHISSSQKSISDEDVIKQSLAEQHESVRSSSLKLDIALSSLLDAQRNLKIIEKHHVSWQQQQKKSEEIKEEYENDDQNGVRFIIKNNRSM